ncbi:MAG: GNAT family N-acetyltransferase [Alphaproteobacteria bacterium]
MIIRAEVPADRAAIRSIVTHAFKDMAYSSGTEAAIVDALRRAGALTLSLVAVEAGEPVGHIAFSPVTIDGRDAGWYGLGPVAVRPDCQGKAIGSGLIREGLAQLAALGAGGCVLLGAPAYYGRFGFKAEPDLRLADVAPAYFQALPFGADVPKGMVAFHAGFEAKEEDPRHVL